MKPQQLALMGNTKNEKMKQKYFAQEYEILSSHKDWQIGLFAIVKFTTAKKEVFCLQKILNPSQFDLTHEFNEFKNNLAMQQKYVCDFYFFQQNKKNEELFDLIFEYGPQIQSPLKKEKYIWILLNQVVDIMILYEKNQKHYPCISKSYIIQHKYKSFKLVNPHCFSDYIKQVLQIYLNPLVKISEKKQFFFQEQRKNIQELGCLAISLIQPFDEWGLLRDIQYRNSCLEQIQEKISKELKAFFLFIFVDKNSNCPKSFFQIKQFLDNNAPKFNKSFLGGIFHGKPTKQVQNQILQQDYQYVKNKYQIFEDKKNQNFVQVEIDNKISQQKNQSITNNLSKFYEDDLNQQVSQPLENNKVKAQLFQQKFLPIRQNLEKNQTTFQYNRVNPLMQPLNLIYTENSTIVIQQNQNEFNVQEEQNKQIKQENFFNEEDEKKQIQKEDIKNSIVQLTEEFHYPLLELPFQQNYQKNIIEENQIIEDSQQDSAEKITFSQHSIEEFPKIPELTPEKVSIKNQILNQPEENITQIKQQILQQQEESKIVIQQQKFKEEISENQNKNFQEQEKQLQNQELNSIQKEEKVTFEPEKKSQEITQPKKLTEQINKNPVKILFKWQNEQNCYKKLAIYENNEEEEMPMTEEEKLKFNLVPNPVQEDKKLSQQGSQMRYSSQSIKKLVSLSPLENLNITESIDITLIDRENTIHFILIPGKEEMPILMFRKKQPKNDFYKELEKIVVMTNPLKPSMYHQITEEYSESNFQQEIKQKEVEQIQTKQEYQSLVKRNLIGTLNPRQQVIGSQRE